MSKFAVRSRKGERGAGSMVTTTETEEGVNVFVTPYAAPPVHTVDSWKEKAQAKAEQAKVAADALAKLSPEERAALGL